MDETMKVSLKRYGIIILGAFLFCLGINLFMVPVGLYNGGVVGLSQIIRSVLDRKSVV